EILVTRSGFNVYESGDDGRTWLHQAGLATDAEGSKYTSYGLIEGKEGYYLYQGSPARMVFHSSGGGYQLIELPKELSHIKHVSLGQSDLFVETSITAWTQSTPFPFFVRARSGGEWQKRMMPKAMCSAIEFLDDAGRRLRTRCLAEKEIYESDDAGAQWRM